MESQFCAEYSELRVKVMQFATDLLDHARTSYELEIMLNYDADGDVWDPGETQTLERLKLALKFKQKQFVAHPNVQQLLATIWYEGLPGWRRLNFVGQGLPQIMGPFVEHFLPSLQLLFMSYILVIFHIFYVCPSVAWHDTNVNNN